MKFYLVIALWIGLLLVLGVAAKDQQHQHDHHHHQDERFESFLKDGKSKIRIGIIGAGVGGSSCSYYLKQALGDDVEITVFEKDIVGGRARIEMIDEEPAELGGSIIHPLNEHINRLVKKMNLEPYDPESESSYTIFDGNKLIFQQSYFSIFDTIKMLYNYRMDPIKFKKERDEIVNRFLKSYEFEEPFETVQQFFDSIDLPNITHVTAQDYFTNNIGMSKPFIEDILSAAIRVNYNQNYDKIAAFAAFIALVGAEDGLYSIKGGNYLLPTRLLEESKSVLVKGKVTTIKKSNDGAHSNYKVSVELDGGKQSDFDFDKVIIATPLELSDIKLENLKIKQDSIVKKSFKTVNTYLVAADGINPVFLNLPKGSKAPLHVLTSHHDTFPLFVASKNPRGELKDGRTCFKVFSHIELSDTYLNSLFLNMTVLTFKPWKAYPILTPTKQFPPIQIEEGLFYINSFEHAVSTMETEVLSSRNVAKLIVKSLVPKKYKSLYKKMDN